MELVSGGNHASITWSTQSNHFAFVSGIWDYWARNISPNKNVKVYIGAPASSSAAGGGYVSASTLTTIAQQTQADFPSFGGLMFWGMFRSTNISLVRHSS